MLYVTVLILRSPPSRVNVALQKPLIFTGPFELTIVALQLPVAHSYRGIVLVYFSVSSATDLAFQLEH
jgi:hypothetical protein